MTKKTVRQPGATKNVKDTPTEPEESVYKSEAHEQEQDQEEDMAGRVKVEEGM